MPTKRVLNCGGLVMNKELKEFLKTVTVEDLIVNKKDNTVIVICQNQKITLCYKSQYYLMKDLTFLNKCRRGEFNQVC